LGIAGLIVAVGSAKLESLWLGARSEPISGVWKAWINHRLISSPTSKKEPNVNAPELEDVAKTFRLSIESKLTSR
jgi:hypothetical protein